MGQDYYKLLGVTKKASTKDIHLAFRREAKRYHPDVCSMSYCEKMFVKLVDAYQTLKNTDKRTLYDNELIFQYFKHTVSEPARERLDSMPSLSNRHKDDEWGWRVG
jgi:DnaJ-class molecular chaperone